MMTIREPNRPSESVVKQLFAKSGNRCAYPNCPAQIVNGTVVVGEICHINAASAGGPRYDPQQSAADRHGYGNLILLCGNHHSIVDGDPEAYTVQRLAKMKSDHESRATLVSSGDIDQAARQLLDQSVTSVNQSGGITAHTVHQTIHVHSSVPPGAERRTLIDAARQLHVDRAAKIAAAQAPVTLMDGGILILHVVPLSTVNEAQCASFDVISGTPDSFPPMLDRFARNRKITYEGLLTASNADGWNQRNVSTILRQRVS